MTLYASSAITAFVPAGGACKGHSIDDGEPGDPNYEYLSVSCPVCEPQLVGDPFWARSPEERPLTEREEREREHLKAQAEKHRQEMDDARDRALIALAGRLDAQDADEDDEKPAKAAPRAKRAPKASGASA